MIFLYVNHYLRQGKCKKKKTSVGNGIRTEQTQVVQIKKNTEDITIGFL